MATHVQPRPVKKRIPVRAAPGDPSYDLALRPKSAVQSLKALLSELGSIRERSAAAVGGAYALVAGAVLARLEHIEDRNAERRYRQHAKAAPSESAPASPNLSPPSATAT